MGDSVQLPTLRVAAEAVAPKVLVVGDPQRAATAADLLDEAEEVGSNREFVTYRGSKAGEAISICSHGVGSAGAGICFEELARADTKVMIRAGTCGAVRDDIADGELVIATAAVRDDGLTERLVPAGFPAVAHHEVIAALEAAAQVDGRSLRSGIVLSTDLFYPSSALGLDWDPWKRSGVIAVEMELGPLFVIASLHDIKAGGVLTVDGNPTRGAGDMSDYDPYRSVVEEGVAAMLATALEALVRTSIDP